VNLKIPLDLGFCDVFTDDRSGERTPTGVVRRGLRPSPHHSRGAAESEHGQCSRPPRTGLSDSFGRPGATTSRRTSRATGAGVGSDRTGVAFGWRRKRRPAGAFGEHGATRSWRAGRRDDRARSAPSGAGWAGSCGEEPKELGPPQLDSVRSVLIGTRTEGSGDRVSVKRRQRVRGRETGVESETRHRPPRRRAGRAM
jgi:hypothetical protein